MDASAVDRWFSQYLEDFAAVARGERQVDVLLERYAVPLLITVDDSVVQMLSAQDVTRVVGAQLDKLRSESFATSVKVSGETAVLNAASAIRREVLSRRRLDSSEVDRVEMTYLITDAGPGPRIAVMAVHDPPTGGPERAERRESSDQVMDSVSSASHRE